MKETHRDWFSLMKEERDRWQREMDRCVASYADWLERQNDSVDEIAIELFEITNSSIHSVKYIRDKSGSSLIEAKKRFDSLVSR